MTPPEETVDPWSTDDSSGLLTNFVGKVRESYFATDPQYNMGRSLRLCLELDVLESDEDSEVAEVTVKYPCGKDWRSDDGGKTASHPAGAKKRFHSSSLLGKFVDSCTGKLQHYGDNATMAATGEKPEVGLDGAVDFLRARGNPQDAAIYAGSIWRFEEVLFDYGEDDDGRPIRSRQNMPVKFIGEGDAPAASGNSAEAVDEETVAKEVAARLQDAGVDLGDGETGQLVAALVSAGDHDAFMDAAMSIDGVTDNDSLMDLVADEESNGLWAVRS
jgi:hypothetical protein